MMYIIILVLGFLSQVYAEKSVVGCVTGDQAKTLNEEIIKMLEATPLVELMTTYSTSVAEGAMRKIEKCYEKEKVLYKLSCMILETVGQDGSAIMKQFEQYKNSQLVGFQNAYEKILNPLIQGAQRIESAITEGNERRLIQLDIISRFRESWMIIRRIRQEHEKTLQSMDVFLKDAIMNKSAEIGEYVRKGNAGNRYSLSSVKSGIRNIDEVLNIDEMISVYYDVLSSTDLIYKHNEFLTNYVLSQAAFAIRRSKLENSLRFRDSTEAERYESFTELKTSNGIRETAKLIRDGLSVGYEEAQKYSESVNTTIDSFEKGFESLNSISIGQNCQTVKQLSLFTANTFVGFFHVLHNMQTAMAASEYKIKIEKFYDDNILTTMNAHSVQPAIKLILKCLPERTNPNVQEAYRFLNQFATTSLGGSNINSFNTTMSQVPMYLEKLLGGFRCYRKIFQVMGNVIQGCKDGRKSFEDLYNEHSTNADLGNSKCTDMALMVTPTKEQIQQIVRAAATKFNFNADCRQNQQSDDPGHIYFDDGLSYADEDDDIRGPSRLSASQKYMVCDLRNKYSKPDNEIAELIKRDVSLVSSARCR